MAAEILFLVKQISPRTSQVYNLGATVSVLLQPSTFEAVKGIRDPLATAHDAFVLIVSERAFVANSH